MANASGYKIERQGKKHALTFRGRWLGDYDTRREARNARDRHNGTRERESGEKFYTWTVQIEVDAVWVADGFDLTDERMHGMLSEHLGYARPEELRAKVLTRPDRKEIRREQGAKD